MAEANSENLPNEYWNPDEDFMEGDSFSLVLTALLGLLPVLFCFYMYFFPHKLEEMEDESPVSTKVNNSPVKSSDNITADTLCRGRFGTILREAIEDIDKCEEDENEEEPPLERPIILREAEDSEIDDEENLSIIPEEDDGHESGMSQQPSASNLKSKGAEAAGDFLYNFDESKMHGKVATARIRAQTKRMMKNMTDNERQQEEQVVNQQLESIIRLLQEHQENLGMSEDDVKQQLNMYKF